MGALQTRAESLYLHVTSGVLIPPDLPSPPCAQQGAKLPFSGAFSQSAGILLPGNCCQFGQIKS